MIKEAHILNVCHLLAYTITDIVYRHVLTLMLRADRQSAQMS